MDIPASASAEDSRTTPERFSSPSPPLQPPGSPKLEHPNDSSASLPQSAQARKVRHNRRLARPPEPDRLHAGWLPRGVRDEVRVNRKQRADRRKRVREFREKQAQETQQRELQIEIQKTRQKELEDWIAQNDWEEKYATQMEEEKRQSAMGEDEMQLHAELQMHVGEWEQHEAQLHWELSFYVDLLARERGKHENLIFF
ncbi:hypothetical protein PVAR5_5109 [Paecilomyces variotii No. 5]|uniref:Uncharacterized protein n=1 Tax=Byssochlamys spectabilis (strain No. 5 / NBRC 109023) TaxID=1356009 RepID=V5I1C2_BYSSN|nr:hypothetical protein PVAR5_5109 [Paecilomyces variotii No. 5]